MQKVKNMESHGTHAISGFELTKHALNILKHYELTPTAINVLLYLTSCYNPKIGYVFPKQKTIAATFNITERSVVRAIQNLVKAGLIIVECKTVNRYRFTSKILNEEALNKKEMSHEDEKNSQTGDKMSSHDHEQIKEEIKKQKVVVKNSNKKEPESVEDYKILKDYAISKGVTADNIPRYIAGIKRNGGDIKILKDFKEKKSADRFYEKQIIETIENNKKVREGIENAVMPWESEAIRNVLKTLRR